MRLAWAFFKRDAAIATSYRFAFAMELLGNFAVLGVAYYIGMLVGERPLPALEAYGGSYLAFLLIGLALTDCVGVSLKAFATQIRDGQVTGSLEATLMSSVPLFRILVYSSLWTYFLGTIRFSILMVFGVLLFDVDVNAKIGAALTVFVLTVLSFAGFGMLWASVVMIIKRGESVATVIGYVVVLLSGVFFPVTMLPDWLQSLTWLIPLTHALDAMRLAILQGYGFADLAGPIVMLACFAVGLTVAGVAGFALAVDVVKRTGSLTQF